MNRLFKNIENGINAILGMMGFAGIAIMTLGVFTRYVLVIPLNWSDEFLRTLFVWSYFIGAAMISNSRVC
ncbi:TRAP transporter small permease [Clostridium vitabionis]|uniref:TRAP transporter small permease n=1 Tax=Clostridium vitabionis TaxID=2784388 RepID=UPI00188D50A5